MATNAPKAKPAKPRKIKIVAAPEAEKPKMGRPSKYTPELVAEICKTLSIGVPIKFACESNGLSYDAWNEWMKGEGGIPPEDIDQFRQQAKKAEAEAVVSRIARITKAAMEGDVVNDRWYLERVYPNEFAKREIHDLQGEVMTKVLEIPGLEELA